MGGMETANGYSALQAKFAGRAGIGSVLEIDAWIPSEVKGISPLVERVMRLVEGSRCVSGGEVAVEIALREALNNAIVHGNRMDAHNLVHVRCRCQVGKGISLVVKDQGQGFDAGAVSDPLAAQNVLAEHGRGIFLMKRAMDVVSFKGNGTEVHMHKASAVQRQKR